MDPASSADVPDLYKSILLSINRNPAGVVVPVLFPTKSELQNVIPLCGDRKGGDYGSRIKCGMTKGKVRDDTGGELDKKLDYLDEIQGTGKWGAGAVPSWYSDGPHRGP